MGKTDKNPVSEIEQLAATIQAGTKNTLRSMLSEAVSQYLREEVLNEDDDEEATETEELETPETESSETEEFDANSEDEMSDETENAEEAATEEPAEGEAEAADDDSDEWSDFDTYKIGDENGSEEYDFTNETDTDTIVKVFKLMKGDDQVSVVKDGDKVTVKDNQDGNEYVIELNPETSDNNEFENGEMTMESLGYTDNYQDKDPIEGLSMDSGAPKNTTDWHKGVPKDTKKPWAGKGNTKPYGEKTEKVFEIALNDAEVVEEEEQPLEENKTVVKNQQKKMTKTSVPANAYVQDGSHVISQDGDYKGMKATNESLQKKVNAALAENKQLKETVAKVSKIMKEAVQVNVNLGHIVKLMMENTTTQEEKNDIVKRFATVKSNDEAKALYESISASLKKANTTVIAESETPVETKTSINESKIYESNQPNAVLDMMKRMKML